jgi:hypothetical protein
MVAVNLAKHPFRRVGPSEVLGSRIVGLVGPISHAKQGPSVRSRGHPSLARSRSATQSTADDPRGEYAHEQPVAANGPVRGAAEPERVSQSGFVSSS